MDIDIFPVGSTVPQRLTGTRPEEGALCSPLMHTRAVGDVDFLQAEGGSIEDYGNARSAMTFTILRIWPNEGIASAYYTDHADTLPAALDKVVFTHRDAQGNLIRRSEKRNAHILCTNVEWVDGRCTNATYQIRWPSA